MKPMKRYMAIMVRGHMVVVDNNLGAVLTEEGGILSREQCEAIANALNALAMTHLIEIIEAQS